ncbi:ATP-dependent serine protease [Burkholderia diffusa]|uniref:ATP-dependent serine protease n=1 Tax=Burkholderia diffusa TaxID=488732 RepID=UPI0026505E81|nr:ATP-dependent serine protease [Burkholderia diffusa]MDN7902589.1 ATP-dependent serine protease [Burkholderia diffusa]
MQVLPNRKVRTRDTLRGALSLRAEPRATVSQRCRQCGFMAFRASEQCPVCGLGGWPFAPLRRSNDDVPAAQAAPTHEAQHVPTWSSRVAAAVRSAALQRPRASSAPLLSILTLVMLVGGYVTYDRTCRANPVCHGPGASRPLTAYASLHAGDAPTLPVGPAPVPAFHAAERAAVDIDRLANANVDTDADRSTKAAQPGNAGTPRHATGRPMTTLARHTPPVHGPDSARGGGIRVADWKGGATATRHAHAIRRVALHTRHGRRAMASAAETAMIYRGH